MGWIIPVPPQRQARSWLIQDEGAEPIELDRDPWPPPPGRALVCVELGLRGDTVHFLYSAEELTALVTMLVGRPKHWLLMPLQRAMTLAGFPGAEKT